MSPRVTSTISLRSWAHEPAIVSGGDIGTSCGTGLWTGAAFLDTSPRVQPRCVARIGPGTLDGLLSGALRSRRTQWRQGRRTAPARSRAAISRTLHVSAERHAGHRSFRLRRGELRCRTDVGHAHETWVQENGDTGANGDDGRGRRARDID